MAGIELAGLIEAIIALFVIMDPFASIPPFLAITRSMKQGGIAEAAKTASLVAGGVLVGFVLIGPAFLGAIGVRMESFRIAGGILLLIMGVHFALGMHLEKERGRKQKISTEVVLIGVPLISGPGAMATSILLAGQHGIETVLAAAIIATVIAYCVLRLAGKVHGILGERGLEISSRLIGIVLAAIGVEFIRLGLGF